MTELNKIEETSSRRKVLTNVQQLSNNLTLETEKSEGKGKGNSKTDFNTLTQNFTSIWNWAIKLTREEDTGIIFERPEWIRLLIRLSYTNGNLIKIVGPQGVGKTTLARYLETKLKERKGKDKVIYRKPLKGQESFGDYETFAAPETVETFDGKKRVIITREREWFWLPYYEKAETIIVDLWDYTKSSQREIVKALDAIQDFWLYCCRRQKRSGDPVPNFVVFLQKEALPLHFFLGKFEYFELKPWKPSALVDCYIQIWKSPFPFTMEALQEIAFLSRGIFRKFKEYIATCLDWAIQQGPAHLKEIKLENVHTLITVEKLTEDLELQLCELWPRSRENRVFAVKVLRYLRKHGPTLQKKLASEIFADNLMGCSRLLNKLEQFGFIKSEKKGVEREWNIA